MFNFFYCVSISPYLALIAYSFFPRLSIAVLSFPTLPFAVSYADFKASSPVTTTAFLALAAFSLAVLAFVAKASRPVSAVDNSFLALTIAKSSALVVIDAYFAPPAVFSYF